MNMTRNSSKTKGKSDPIIVSITFNSKQHDITSWAVSAAIEYFGVHLEDKQNKKLKQMRFIFDRVVNAKEFYELCNMNCIELDIEGF